MLAVNYTELRGNMKECMDKVSDDFETLIVTRKKNKNMHLIGNEENYKWLMESKRQLKEGMLQMKELIEVSEDE